jgi:hypothetical protein
MAKRQEDLILENIKPYFGFLLDKGYTIREIKYFREAFGNWYVILESFKYFVKIDCDRNYISVLFDPEKANSRHQIGLESLVYYLSKGNHFVGYFEGNPAWGKNKQLERLSSLLNGYHDQIAELFETDYERLKEDFAPSQKRYSELLKKSYSKKVAAEEKAWKSLHLFALLYKLIGIGVFVYLSWGVSMMFITAKDNSMKLMYGSLAAATIVILAMLALKVFKDLQK